MDSFNLDESHSRGPIRIEKVKGFKYVIFINKKNTHTRIESTARARLL